MCQECPCKTAASPEQEQTVLDCWIKVADAHFDALAKKLERERADTIARIRTNGINAGADKVRVGVDLGKDEGTFIILHRKK